MLGISSAFNARFAGQYALQLLQTTTVVQHTDSGRNSASVTLRLGTSSDSDDNNSVISTLMQIIMDAKGNTALSVRADDGEVSAHTDGGDDKLDIHAGRISQTYAGEGNDTLNLTSSTPREPVGSDVYSGIFGVGGGKGNDTLNLTTDRIVFSADGGDGNDTINIDAPTAVAISGGDGDDVITINGGAIGVQGGDGNDEITINAKASIHAISGGKGNDHVVLNLEGTALTAYDYSRGDGIDLIDTNNALEIAFSDESRKNVLDMSRSTISKEGNRLTIDLGNGQDAIVVQLTGRMAEADGVNLSYNAETGKLLIADDQYYAAGAPGQPLMTFTRPAR